MNWNCSKVRPSRAASTRSIHRVFPSQFHHRPYLPLYTLHYILGHYRNTCYSYRSSLSAVKRTTLAGTRSQPNLTQVPDTSPGALGTAGTAGWSRGAGPNTSRNRDRTHTLTRQACSTSINSQISRGSSSCGCSYQVRWGARGTELCLHLSPQSPR
jgi:hypothetical protein